MNVNQKTPADGDNLIAMIANAGQDQLDEIVAAKKELDDQIATARKEVLERIRKLGDSRAGLVVVEKTIRMKLEGRPGRQGSGKLRAGRRYAIEELLADGKPRTSQAIADATRIPLGSFSALLNEERFEKTAGGWTLSKKASSRK